MYGVHSYCDDIRLMSHSIEGCVYTLCVDFKWIEEEGWEEV